MIVGEPKLLFVKPPGRLEIADGGSLGERLDRNDDVCAEPLALAGDSLVCDY